MKPPSPRPHGKVASAALKALVLREAVARMFGRRAALAWLLLEPTLHICALVFVYSVLRVRHVAGMDTGWWIASGMLAYFLFLRTAWRSTQAIDANRALFTYRQVHPVDTVVARCVLEGFFAVMVTSVTLVALALAGLRVGVEDPWGMIAAAFGLWLLAVGWALCLSVAVSLIPEIGVALSIAGMGMMVISGVMFPISQLPHPVREWLFINPVAHGVEGVRASVSRFYHHAPELDLSYLIAFALTLVFAGLVLQVRFKQRVLAE